MDADGLGDFTTIQAAVDAALPGQVILVNPSTNPIGYSEEVTITRPGIAIIGFSDAASFDVDDPLSATCPTVVLDGCDTSCGNTILEIDAPNVIVQRFNVRHGVIRFTGNGSGSAVQQSCFRGGEEDAIRTSGTTADNLLIDSNVFHGAIQESIVSTNKQARGESAIAGYSFLNEPANPSVVSQELVGDGHVVTNNAIPSCDDGIRVQGNDFLVSNNVILSCNDDVIDVEGNNGV